MATAERLQTVVPRITNVIPTDLVVILLFTGIVNLVVFIPIISETPLRVVFGLPFVLFVPGYVAICTLFPQRHTPRSTSGSTSTVDVSGIPFWKFEQRDSIDWAERLALSVAASVVIVPAIVFILGISGFGVTLLPAMTGVTALTILLTITAIIRRSAVPAENRFQVPFRQWIDRIRSGLFEQNSRKDTRLNVLLVITILLAAGVAGFAVASPGADDGYSALAVLTENETGDLVTDNVSQVIEQGEDQPIVVAIDNEEHRTVNYTTVVVEQSVDDTGDEPVVDSQEEIDRFDASVDHGETGLYEQSIQSTTTDEDVRIVWLLYLDTDVPDEPSIDNADRSVYVWIDGGE